MQLEDAHGIMQNTLRGRSSDHWRLRAGGLLVARKEKEEETTITKTMKIEGMMCGHCEARVKKVLEALDGVEQAEVSHETGTAVVEMTEEVADEVLKKAVEDQDYKVLGIDF